jgi:peroxiredoxin
MRSPRLRPAGAFVPHKLPTRTAPAPPAPCVATAPPKLDAGDIAPSCALRTLDGSLVDIRADDIAGKPVVLMFCPQISSAMAEAIPAAVDALPAYTAQGALLFAVTRDGTEAASTSSIPFPVLLDANGQVFTAFGAGLHGPPTTVVLRPNQHVLAVLTSAARDQARDALKQIERIAHERATIVMTPHPPVLMVPDVLSPQECQRLIEVFETRGQTFMPPGPGIDYIGTDYKMRVPEHGRADRIDHWIVDADTTALLHRRLEQRLLPEIAKAFHYRITRWERMRIGCYQGERGGKLHGHRDNIEPTPYRRFAVSINLDTESFSGGELRFPEFGDQRYRPASGTAIVFSSSLLHEALHVTSGRRLVLLVFMFGDS